MRRQSDEFAGKVASDRKPYGLPDTKEDPALFRTRANCWKRLTLPTLIYDIRSKNPLPVAS